MGKYYLYSPTIWTFENNIVGSTGRMLCLWVNKGSQGFRHGYSGQSSLKPFQLCIHLCWLCVCVLAFSFFFFFWLCLWGGRSLIRPPNLKSKPIKSLAPPWLDGTLPHPDYCSHLASSASSGITTIRPAFSFWHLSNMCWQKAVRLPACLHAHPQARTYTHSLSLPLFATLWSEHKPSRSHPWKLNISSG